MYNSCIYIERLVQYIYLYIIVIVIIIYYIVDKTEDTDATQKLLVSHLCRGATPFFFLLILLLIIYSRSVVFRFI